jgi:transcriptional regulator with XRE-family HTH domain
MVKTTEKKIEKKSWYEEFVEEVMASSFEDAKKVVKMIEVVQDNENESDVEEIRALILSGEMTEVMKEKFDRRLKLLQNRLDRAINENFGSFIKHLRESKEYSLKDLEALTGVSSSYINRIEKGERKSPSYQIIKQLADALGQDINDLLNIANNNPSHELTSIEQVILTNDFTIGGKQASKELKQKLVDVIIRMNNAPWEDKFKEMMEISASIDLYKEVSKKE